MTTKQIEHIILASGTPGHIKESPHPTNTIYELSENEHAVMFCIRLTTLALLLTLLMLHIRSLRVFRWEQSVTGGVLVTYTIAVTGLVLCSGTNKCISRALQAYISSTGAVLLLANCGGIWHRWRHSPEMTRAVAELLIALGIPIRTYIILKVFLSALTAVIMIVDLAMVPIFSFLKYGIEFEPERL